MWRLRDYGGRRPDRGGVGGADLRSTLRRPASCGTGEAPSREVAVASLAAKLAHRTAPCYGGDGGGIREQS